MASELSLEILDYRQQCNRTFPFLKKSIVSAWNLYLQGPVSQPLVGRSGGSAQGTQVCASAEIKARPWNAGGTWS
jgi:hypothetical protein